MRKLASVQEIRSIEPIPGADMIVKARCQGWDVVVGKDEFKEGDKCVFLEIDSLCDPVLHPWAKCLERTHYRVKTVKLRKTLSQGLAVPLSEFKQVLDINSLSIGDDLTEVLGIKKWEPGQSNKGFNSFKAGKTAKPFPTHLLPKTEEIRIQSALYLLEELKGKPYSITTKMDGTSATYLIDPDTDEFLACSRNFARKRPKVIKYNFLHKFINKIIFGKFCKEHSVNKNDSIYWDIAKKYNIEEKLRKYPYYAIQGEICGPGIQGNPLNLTESKFFIFNLINLETRSYCGDTCLSIFDDMSFVPCEEFGNNFNYTLDELLDKAKGLYPGTNNYKEGIVVRGDIVALEESSVPYNDLISFKAINNDFLLKEK